MYIYYSTLDQSDIYKRYFPSKLAFVITPTQNYPSLFSRRGREREIAAYTARYSSDKTSFFSCFSFREFCAFYADYSNGRKAV